MMFYAKVIIKCFFSLYPLATFTLITCHTIAVQMKHSNINKDKYFNLPYRVTMKSLALLWERKSGQNKCFSESSWTSKWTLLLLYPNPSSELLVSKQQLYIGRIVNMLENAILSVCVCVTFLRNYWTYEHEAWHD